MAADGVVVIDTKIDQGGFNAGMKKLKASALTALNAVLLPVVKIGDKIRTVFEKAFSTVAEIGKKLLIGTFLLFALSLQKIVASLRDAMGDVFKLSGADTVRQVEEIQNSFEDLKAAVANAFLPLITTAIPYIKSALSWLIELFNKVAMITAAFMGQKQALQIIQGSAQKIADANKKTEKAARGQLAAFDQINILQQEDAETTDPSELPKVAGELLPITDDILSKVQAIKNEIAEWFADPIGKLQETWGKIVEWFRTNVLEPIIAWWNDTWAGQLLGRLWTNFIDTWAKIFENTRITLQTIKDKVIQFFTGIIQFVIGVFTGNWKLAWEGIRNIFEGVWGAIVAFAKGAFNNLVIYFTGLVNQFKILFQPIEPFIKAAFINAVNAIKSVWGGIVGWFMGNIINPIQNGFTSLANWIRNSLENAFGNIGNIARGAFNDLIDILNSIMDRVAQTVNNMAGMINQFSWMMGGFQIPTVSAPHVPHLATGAVIPPNAEFLAVLGDQKSGRNIEAPENLIRKIIREELGNTDNEMTVSMPVYLDGELIYQNSKKVSARHGKNLLSK